MGRRPADINALRTECWEDIVLRLPPSEIPLIRLVNRRFRELIDNSPAIKYRLDLFSAGLEERDAGDSLSIQDRRQKLESYCSRWESFDHTKLTPLALPDNQDAYLNKGFLIYSENAGGNEEKIHSIRLPSPMMGLPRKEWTIQVPLSSVPCGWAIHPPSDLLAIPVASQEKNSFKIGVFHMSDGSRYLNCGVMGFNYGSLMQFRMIHLELTDCRISVQVYPRIIAGSFLSVHHDLFVWDWRTGKKYLERTQTRIAIAHFIDEYQLIGIVRRGDKDVLMLWDTSNNIPNDSMCPLGLILETGTGHVPFSGLSVPRYNMNHELPFRENRSMGIVVFRICNPSHELTFIEIYAIPVGTLAKFPPVGKLEWSKWQCFATLAGVRPPGPPRLSHILHSWALNVHIPHGSRRSEVILQVYDFSLRSRRRKARDDPSAPFPSYTVQEFPLNPNYRTSSLEFTDSGILVTLPGTGSETKKRQFWAI